MTSLLEKSLITGFGIFALILFLILISPFIQKIEEYKKNEEEEELDEYTNFINKINSAIKYSINHPGAEFIENIEYPENMNISFKDNYVKFDFLLENKIYSKIINYEAQFVQKYYYNMPSKTYQLNITHHSSLINVYFNKLD